MANETRRVLVKSLLSITGITAVSGKVAAAIVTPNASEGPFYPTIPMRTPDTDNNLVKIAGKLNEAGGEILHLSGKITDKDGTSLANHRIEIWQCDVNGKYLHPGDDRSIDYDTGFQGFGYDITDQQGQYRFITIKPTTYPGRTPHIHVKLFNGKQHLLTTQFYIANEPGNQNDSLYRRMTEKQAEAVSMVLLSSGGVLKTIVDVVI